MSANHIANYAEQNHPNLTSIRSVDDFKAWVHNHKSDIERGIAVGAASGITSKAIHEAWDLLKKGRK